MPPLRAVALSTLAALGVVSTARLQLAVLERARSCRRLKGMAAGIGSRSNGQDRVHPGSDPLFPRPWRYEGFVGCSTGFAPQSGAAGPVGLHALLPPPEQRSRGRLCCHPYRPPAGWSPDSDRRQGLRRWVHRPRPLPEREGPHWPAVTTGGSPGNAPPVRLTPAARC